MKMLKITLQGKTYEVGVEVVDGAAPATAAPAPVQAAPAVAVAVPVAAPAPAPAPAPAAAAPEMCIRDRSRIAHFRPR